MIYGIARFLVRLALGVFFRKIEVEGKENVPHQGPVLIAANHTNALVDPLVIATQLRRPITVTAKSTLTQNPLLALLFRIFHVVPFYRREDPGVDPARNLGSLEECRQRLARGAAICIFPEGQSHSDPHLRPFRTGVGRIVQAWFETPGSAPLTVVPVGHVFQDNGRLRSAVWVRFGPPMDAAQWRTEHPDAGPRELTEEIEERVRRLTLNFRRERYSVLLGWAADVVATRAAPPPALGRESMTLADRVRLVQRLNAGYEDLEKKRPVEIAALVDRVRRYVFEVHRIGISPAEVYLPMGPSRAAFFILREFELIIIGLPLALWGAMNHMLPYWMVRLAERRLTRARDQRASSIIFTSLLLFPLFYAAQIATAWMMLSPLWATIYTISLPYSGYFAALYGERVGGILQRSRTFLRFLFRPKLQEHLMDEGRGILDEIVRLGREVA